MRRDPAKVRAVLEKLEAMPGRNYFVGSMTPMGDTRPDQVEEWYYLKMLISGGLVEEIQGGAVALTWHGHDFIDAIRDKDIWNNVQATIEKEGGSFTIEMIKKLAEGFLKEKLKKATGFDL